MGISSIWHWLIVLLIVMIVFGTKKLRNMGGDLGGAIKNFKEGMKDANSDINTTHSANPNATPQHQNTNPQDGVVIDVQATEKK